MTFDLPDHAQATFDAQARLFSNDLKAITQTASLTGVKNGCGVTAQGSPNMTVAVAAGACYFLNAEVAVAGGNVTITTAHATWPRIDIVVVNSSGVKSVVAGTAAEFPLEPATPAGSIMLAQVYVPANDTAIGSTQIRDRGIILQIPSGVGNTVIVRKTATETVTSSTVFQDDNHLLFAMTSNTIYQVKLFVFATSASNGAMKFTFAGPAGSTFRMVGITSGQTVPIRSEDASSNYLSTAGVGANPVVALFEGVVATTATSGDFKLQWAQSVSSGSGHTVGINSYLEYRQLA